MCNVRWRHDLYRGRPRCGSCVRRTDHRHRQSFGNRPYRWLCQRSSAVDWEPAVVRKIIGGRLGAGGGARGHRPFIGAGGGVICPGRVASRSTADSVCNVRWRHDLYRRRPRCGSCVRRGDHFHRQSFGNRPYRRSCQRSLAVDWEPAVVRKVIGGRLEAGGGARGHRPFIGGGSGVICLGRVASRSTADSVCRVRWWHDLCRRRPRCGSCVRRGDHCHRQSFGNRPYRRSCQRSSAVDWKPAVAREIIVR